LHKTAGPTGSDDTARLRPGSPYQPQKKRTE
jgi:hypothetical protein